MNLKCLFGFHKLFWEDIEFKFEKYSRVWNILNIKVCTCCGKVKVFVEGKNDNGRFRAIDGNQVQEYGDKKRKWLK